MKILYPKQLPKVDSFSESNVSTLKKECDLTEKQTQYIFSRSKRGKNIFHFIIILLLFVLYLLFLVYKAVHHNQVGSLSVVPLGILQDSQMLLACLGNLALMILYKFAYFVLLGFMAIILISYSLGRLRIFVISLLGILTAGTLTVLMQAIANDWSLDSTAIVSLIIPVLGCFFGIWMGKTWLGGRRACIWFLPKVAGLILLIALCTSIIIKMSVQQKPMSFEAAKITSSDKRRLGNLFRSKNPQDLIEGQSHTLQLTENDINLLLSWGLSLGSPNRKARVELMHDSVSLAVSMGILPGDRTRYLNLKLDGLPVIKDGNMSLYLNRMQLGNLEVPKLFLNLISPFVTSLLKQDARSKPFLDATQTVVIDNNFFEVTYGPLFLDTQSYREQLFGSTNAGEKVLASTRAQVENLLDFVDRLPDKQPDFAECFETVFSLAHNRSIDSDPITENKAGIFALGILLGHPRFEEFLGPVHTGRDKYVSRRVLSQVELRGRADWTKHFCLAASITLLSDEAVSHAASVFKEDLDANRRSADGFSFSDLLMGLIGTKFAILSTQNEMSARKMQERIIGGFRVEEFVPQAGDLPEGISDAELQSQYGGVGGDKYNQLIQEIERRISDCEAYQPF